MALAGPVTAPVAAAAAARNAAPAATTPAKTGLATSILLCVGMLVRELPWWGSGTPRSQLPSVINSLLAGASFVQHAEHRFFLE
jgi:hypothetical protein